MHPRIFLNGKVGTDKLCRMIHGRSSLSVGDVKNAFEMLAQIFIGMWLKAPIEICFTIEIVYYTLLLITSYIYLKKAKWQNKKI